MNGIFGLMSTDTTAPYILPPLFRLFSLSQMTFNPQRYEYPYGIHLIDDIHNVFPEFLYDAGMFPGNQLLTFLQMRVNELFPEEYAHNRTQYRLFQLERRRREAGIPLPMLPQTPPRRRVHPMAMPATPARPTRFHRATPQAQQAPQTPQTTHATITPLTTFTVPLNTLFTTAEDTAPLNTNGILNTLLTSALFGSHQDLADLLTPVPVVPTPQQLAAASIVSTLEPPNDVQCTICQDHEPPVNGPDAAEWRILRHCGHRFHRTCIDQWFRQNVHCPVCRHDIRDFAEDN